MTAVLEKQVNPHFEDFLFDWDYKTYFLVGGYGSSKSYHAALKIYLKALEEKRTILVVREVYDTHRDSTFSLFSEITEDLGLGTHVKIKTSPMTIQFPNGSKIIFRGMDKPEKLKSINNISIIWLEECSEIKYAGYKELLGRLRHPTLTLHMVLTTNPVSKDNWAFTHFFKDDVEGRHVLDDEKLYNERIVIVGNTYYHHSVVDDNYFVQAEYIAQLDEIKEYDPDLYRIARKGQFGVNGKLILPQLEEWPHEQVEAAMHKIHNPVYKNGMDFGFSESFNALVRMVVDRENEWLYIFHEYYKKDTTDDILAEDLLAEGMAKKLVKADNAEPKTIAYLQKRGLRILPCYKLTRVENTKKVKRFKKIIVSSKCTNTLRELKPLTAKIDPRTGKEIPGEFNIDPHTFSAIWYGLDDYVFGSMKGYNAKR